jgi:hypothetical protein
MIEFVSLSIGGKWSDLGYHSNINKIASQVPVVRSTLRGVVGDPEEGASE